MYVCMCVCVYVCIYVYMCMCVCVHVYVYICCLLVVLYVCACECCRATRTTRNNKAATIMFDLNYKKSDDQNSKCQAQHAQDGILGQEQPHTHQSNAQKYRRDLDLLDWNGCLLKKGRRKSALNEQ